MKKETDKDKVTCYSGGEGEFMDWSQSLRGRWLEPLLAWMAGLGMRGSHVTFASMIAGLIFCPLFA